MAATSVIGRAPERLTPVERVALAGKFVALEIYTPQTLPLRKIEAVGESPAECAQALAVRGLDPGKFEYVMLFRAWPGN